MKRNDSPLALCSLLLALLALCTLPFAAHAQTATATLTGTVTDQNGAVVPGTMVTVLNQATSLERETTTNSEGYFTMPLLPPGAYTVRAQHDGFMVVQIDKIVLNVGDQKSLPIQMKTGDIKETVNITGEESLINQSPAISTTIDRMFAASLPLNGRSFQSLILLTPGVTVVRAAFDGGQFSVNGQRANSNYFTVDGVSANIGASTIASAATNTAQAGAVPGLTSFGGTNNLVSVDALEEFKIQTSTYTAEFGRQPGGQVQLVTRSGTNAFHGTVFEFFRNEALDARNYFNRKPAPKPPLRQNMFGGTFSGPLFLPKLGEGHDRWYNGANRTFFFFSYEGLRLRLPISGVQNVPSVRLRQVAASSLQPILNAFPIPTGAETIVTCNPATDSLCTPQGNKPSGFAPYTYGVSSPTNHNATSIRIDHTINGKHSLFGRYNDAVSDTFSRSPSQITTPSVAKTSTRTATAGMTSILSPQLTNELRFNWSRQKTSAVLIFDSIGGATPIDLAALTTGYTGSAGRITGSAFFSFNGGFGSIGLGNPADSFQRQINIVDNVSLAKGKHQFRFGVDYRRLAPEFARREYDQSASILSEQSVRTGIIGSVSILASDNVRPIFHNLSAYVQDTWKATGRLTLDMGLRWEFNPPPTEASGKQPITVIGADNLPTATLRPNDAPAYKTAYNGFAPRLGLAYVLRSKHAHETVLRGGFGVYYDMGSGQATTPLLFGPPFSASTFLSNVSYPLSPAQAAPPAFPTITLPTTALLYSIDPNLELPYTLDWNFTVEQSLGSEHVLSVSYVAAAGRRLLVTRRFNEAPRNPVTGALLPRPNPNFNLITYITNDPSSDYHSLQAQYRARMRRGIQALVNYTWSHAIDEVSNEITNGVLLRGNADFDVRHNLSAALTFAVPGAGRNANSFVKALINDWTFDTLVHAQSGRPVDLISGTSVVRDDGVSFSVRPDVIADVPFYLNDPSVPGGRRFNTAAFRNPPTLPGGFPARQGNFGRNVLRELPLYQFDFALGKSFMLSEQLRLQFKGEVFNIFNHPMFALYSSAWTNQTTFGIPSTTMSSGLGGLSALYQLGGPRSVQLSARLSF